jgi:hypothetical protein
MFSYFKGTGNDRITIARVSHIEGEDIVEILDYLQVHYPEDWEQITDKETYTFSVKFNTQNPKKYVESILQVQKELEELEEKNRLISGEIRKLNSKKIELIDHKPKLPNVFLLGENTYRELSNSQIEEVRIEEL